MVGPDHVGKSTFIESALDMKHSLSSRATTKKMSLDGTVYLVRLLEIDTLEISIGSNGEIQWPKLGGDSPPSVDGVLVLHDVTQPGSLSNIKGLLGLFSCSELQEYLDRGGDLYANNCSLSGRLIHTFSTGRK